MDRGGTINKWRFNGLIAAKPTATSICLFRLGQSPSFNGLIAAKPTATSSVVAADRVTKMFQRPDSGQTHCNSDEDTLELEASDGFNGLIAAKPTATK